MFYIYYYFFVVVVYFNDLVVKIKNKLKLFIWKDNIERKEGRRDGLFVKKSKKKV